MKKIKSHLKKTEGKFLIVVSSLLLLNSLFLFTQKVDKLQIISFPQFVGPSYILSLLVILSLLFYLIFKGKNFLSLSWLKKIALIFLPSVLVLTVGVNITKNFHWFFDLAVGFYVIFVGILLIAHRHQKISTNKKERKKIFQQTKEWFRFQGWKTISTLGLLMIISFSFGIHNLEKQALVDENLWVFKRVERYWRNVGELDWKGTRISDKPGITVALISGIGLLSEDPTEYSKHEKETPGLSELFFALRFPLFIFVILSLFLFYFFLEKLLGKKSALLSCALIAISPILLGMSRIINPDTLLWIFMPLSLLAFLNFIKKENISFLYWTGIFLGLALLTKYIANILVVFFFLLIFLVYIFSSNKKDYRVYIKNSFLSLSTLFFIALSIFYLLFPAVWIKPKKLLDATLTSQAFETTWYYFVALIFFILLDLWILKGKIIKIILDFFRKNQLILTRMLAGIFLLSVAFVFLNTFFDMQWFDFEKILASPKSSYRESGLPGIFFSAFYPTLFGINILAVLGILASAIFLLKKDSTKKSASRVALFLITFVLLYYFASAVTKVGATVRYQIIIYPIILILAAIGWKHLLSWFSSISKKSSIIFNSRNLLWATIVFGIFSFWQIKPFYFSYANQLLPEKYVLNPKDMGDGSYQMAKYLNTLPEAEKLTVWSDKEGICMYFLGKCKSGTSFEDYITNDIQFDYYVISKGREARTTGLVNSKKGYEYLIRLDVLYTFEGELEYEINPGGRKSNYIKIIDDKKIDVPRIINSKK